VTKCARAIVSFSQLFTGYYCNSSSLMRELYDRFLDYEFAQCPDLLKYAANFLSVQWIKFNVLFHQIRCVIYIILKMCVCVCVCARARALII